VSGTYQEMIAGLERYWADYGCVIMQPYHTELGAGTFNPATFLRCLGPDPWRTGATARTLFASSTTSSTRWS
jgi:glycyl-tRNA synthetase alpha subunit